MRRFSRRISGDSLRSGVPLRNASMPPLNSIVRIALVDRRSRIEPTLSDNSETVCRFGRKRRLVLRLEWLTLLPTCTPLPVTGHLRAMPRLAFSPRSNPRSPMRPRERGFYVAAAIGSSTRAQTAHRALHDFQSGVGRQFPAVADAP